jgi:mRNA interferase HigB
MVKANADYVFEKKSRANASSVLSFSEKYLENPKKGGIFAKKWNMRIIAKSTLVAYYTKNPKAKVALEDWYEKTKEAKWTCFADIKRTFNSVDSVGNKRYVFNIKGNDYRLIVLIKFTVSHVLIRFVGTHAEYDKITDIQNI